MKFLLPLLSLLVLVSFSGCATTSSPPGTETRNGKNIQVEESWDTPRTSAVYLPGPY